MYYLETITPMHIGNGEEYSSFEYLLNGDNIEIYDFDKVVNFIIENFNTDELISSLKKEELKFLKQILNKYNINYKQFLKETIPFEGNRQYFPKKILKFISQNTFPYIPGSEIKGAIRTAIIYHFISKYYYNDFLREFKSHFAKKIKDVLNIIDELKKLKNDYQNNRDKIKEKNIILKQKKKKLINNIKKYSESYIKSKLSFLNNDSKYDFMKVISIEDSLPINKGKIIGTVVVSNIKKLKFINCEMIDKNLKIKFPLNLINVSSTLIEKYISLIYKLKKEDKSTFLDYYLEFLKEYNTEEKILNLTSNFYKKLSKVEKLDINLDKNEYLIRIGRFKGFFSNTIWLLYLNSDKKFFGEFFEAIAPKGYKNNPAKSKKSIQNSFEQLGWCKIVKDNDKNRK